AAIRREGREDRQRDDREGHAQRRGDPRERGGEDADRRELDEERDRDRLVHAPVQPRPHRVAKREDQEDVLTTEDTENTEEETVLENKFLSSLCVLCVL